MELPKPLDYKDKPYEIELYHISPLTAYYVEKMTLKVDEILRYLEEREEVGHCEYGAPSKSCRCDNCLSQEPPKEKELCCCARYLSDHEYELGRCNEGMIVGKIPKPELNGECTNCGSKESHTCVGRVELDVEQLLNEYHTLRRWREKYGSDYPVEEEIKNRRCQEIIATLKATLR